MKSNLTTCAVTLAAAGSALATTYTKPPDLGNFWNPLSPNGSYVYADSFIAPEDCVITNLGTWLDDLGTGGSSLRFEVWGDNNGPDAGNVISTTGSIFGSTGTGLTYNEFAASPGNIVAGQKYWFAATAVGESGNGRWQVGGHTQNSVYVDNGTFWYSNDSNGINFDGQNLTPEMAFSFTCQVPTPGSAALLGLGGLVATRRRRA